MKRRANFDPLSSNRERHLADRSNVFIVNRFSTEDCSIPPSARAVSCVAGYCFSPSRESFFSQSSPEIILERFLSALSGLMVGVLVWIGPWLGLRWAASKPRQKYTFFAVEGKRKAGEGGWRTRREQEGQGRGEISENRVSIVVTSYDFLEAVATRASEPREPTNARESRLLV